MTNLEAIEELRDIDRHLDIVFERTLPKKAEAIHLAVKALEATDQISTMYHGVEMMPKGVFEEIYKDDKEEQKVGEWEEVKVIPNSYDIMGKKTWASLMRCNKCSFMTFAIEGQFAQYNYCPNCGAKMIKR